MNRLFRCLVLHGRRPVRAHVGLRIVELSHTALRVAGGRAIQLAAQWGAGRCPSVCVVVVQLTSTPVTLAVMLRSSPLFLHQPITPDPVLRIGWSPYTPHQTTEKTNRPKHEDH